MLGKWTSAQWMEACSKVDDNFKRAQQLGKTTMCPVPCCLLSEKIMTVAAMSKHQDGQGFRSSGELLRAGNLLAECIAPLSI